MEFSSEIAVDMVKAYVYDVYPKIRKENDPVHGAASAGEVRVRPLTFDELNYALHAEGTRLYLFGGPWDEGTQRVIGRINDFAGRYGAGEVHAYDFFADSQRAETNFKTDLTQQAGYDGPGKRPPVPAAEFNYAYGELVTHHLKNLGDFVRSGEITFLNLYEDAVTVPDLREPFLFLHNREKGIIAGVELGGVAEAELDRVLEDQIFSKLAEYPVTPYTCADYVRDAYARNERGHAFKTEDCFRKGEQINLQPVTFPVLRWILRQEGTFAVLFAGAWCANSQAGVATVNDYAVANGVRVYMIDVRIDGKHPIDFWKYPRSREFRLNSAPTRAAYFDLWENELADAPVLVRLGRADADGPVHSPVQTYVDEAGTEHRMLGVDIPYFFAYNKDGRDARGNVKTVLDAVNHEGIELINVKPSFVYYAPNYQRYKSGVYRVFHAYKKRLGQEAREIAIDRTAPLAEGEEVRHVETVAYHKEHNWYRERPCSGDAR